MIRRILALGVVLALAGCGLPAAVVVPIVTSTASYIASVNNLGAETLKVYDDQHPAPPTCKPALTAPATPQPAGKTP